MRHSRSCLNALIAVSAIVAAPASAAITDLVIRETRPYGTFAAGKFVRLDGEVVGSLAPTEPIADIDKAPRDARGRVSYRTQFTLIIPEQTKAGNGALVIDVMNRGKAVTHMFYNSPRERPLPWGNLDGGTGFLQNRGYSVAAVQWELGEGVELPTFVDDKGDKRFVEGIAFAVVRDIALFLRHDRSRANPLAGRIDRVIASGYSQTARLLKSFLVMGMNEADGKQAFDGLHVIAGTAGVIPVNASGKGPGSVAAATPSHSNAELRGVHEEPFTYEAVMQAVAARNRFVPRIMVTNMNTDYLSSRTSLIRTGARGTEEATLPANVRMYDIAGAAHLNVRIKDKNCDDLPGQLDWSPALRAQLVALDEWVRRRADPPASRLMPLGPQRGDARVLDAPKFLPGAVILVPQVDQDGNSLGGVRLPDLEVPLGQHGDLNSPMSQFTCRLAGSYRPFAKTLAERIARNDTRQSLEERYPGGLNEYTSRIRTAARSLVADRLLLPEDAAIIENAAADNASFSLTPLPQRGR